MISEIVRELKL